MVGYKARSARSQRAPARDVVLVERYTKSAAVCTWLSHRVKAKRCWIVQLLGGACRMGRLVSVRSASPHTIRQNMHDVGVSHVAERGKAKETAPAWHACCRLP